MFSPAQVAAAGGRFEIVYVSQDASADAMVAACSSMPWVALPWRHANEKALRYAPYCACIRHYLSPMRCCCCWVVSRQRFHIVAAVLPELILLDSRCVGQGYARHSDVRPLTCHHVLGRCGFSGSIIGTDGVKALARGSLDATNFPRWRTNAYQLRLEAGSALSGVRMAPDSVLRCGLYPGDAIVVAGKEVSGTACENVPSPTRICISCFPLPCPQFSHKVAAYVNPPISERDIPDDGDEARPSEELDTNAVYLPQSLACQLGQSVGDTVIITPASELPGELAFLCVRLPFVFSLRALAPQKRSLSPLRCCPPPQQGPRSWCLMCFSRTSASMPRCVTCALQPGPRLCAHPRHAPG